MNLLTVTNTAATLTKTPFKAGFQAVFFNQSGLAATLQGSEDGVTYTTTVNAAATGTMTAVPRLPRFVRLLAAGTNVYLLQGGN